MFVDGAFDIKKYPKYVINLVDENDNGKLCQRMVTVLDIIHIKQSIKPKL